MKHELVKVALRQNAIYIPNVRTTELSKKITETTSVLLANAKKMGFSFSENLLHAFNEVNPAEKLSYLEILKDVTGVSKNWTPLVKGWDVPTGESITDHIMSFFATIFQARGTVMPCKHIIPADTFPLERYNGCPFCGTPFQFEQLELKGQGTKHKVLDLWTDKEILDFFKNLLQSKTALDATQIESLKTLLQYFPLPDVEIGMKETVMVVLDFLIEKEKLDDTQKYMKTPVDVLRYLWYKKTGFLQIVEPKTILKRTAQNNKHIFKPADTSAEAVIKSKMDLKLKYSRKECLMAATWLNNINMDANKMCESMHPKRGIWIRMIRALRLPEYSKKKGFEKLSQLLDVFYNQTYEVWQGVVNHYRLKADGEKAFELLKQRPGLFARSLFSNMLWFGPEQTIGAFTEIIDQVPARLLFTLNMYAQIYFDKNSTRSVKPLGGVNKTVPANRLLSLYSNESLESMKLDIENLCIEAMKRRFKKIPTKSKTMYIDPGLFNIPVSIGDRSSTVQDLPSALMGTTFPIDGDEVRLFMQWGTGLPAQHMDMDLSCQIAFADKTEFCSYYHLVATGSKHSGDIRSIPNKIGTAEYISINVDELNKAGAKYVTFTCNAYSNGSITPNLIVGWMNNKYPMTISETSGVAYDPSCVQHQVRVTQSVAKGLVFGVLDVEAKEIIWLELAFGGQIVQGLDFKGVKALLNKLKSKLNIGSLLKIKAEAQQLKLIETPDADENYDMKWARDTAEVTKLLVD